MPHLAPQFHLTLHPNQPDAFHITGTPGNIHVDAATIPTLLFGVNWYLKYVAHLQVSTNGLQLGAANLILPAPPRPSPNPPSTRPATPSTKTSTATPLPTGPTPAGSTRSTSSPSPAPTPSSSSAAPTSSSTRPSATPATPTSPSATGSPSPPTRTGSSWATCAASSSPSPSTSSTSAPPPPNASSPCLRALGITPVLPGYYGIVPADFATLHPGAHVITQGDWNGFTRPGWIDPRDPNFANLAASFYRHQRDLFGDSILYDMEIFQEGGTTGDVPPGPAAKLVQTALETAHPNASGS